MIQNNAPLCQHSIKSKRRTLNRKFQTLRQLSKVKCASEQTFLESKNKALLLKY